MVRVKGVTANIRLQNCAGTWQKSFTSVVSSGNHDYQAFLPKFPFHKPQKSNKNNFEATLEGVS